MLYTVLKRSFVVLILCGSAEASSVAPKVGRSAAAKYFQKNPENVTRYVASDDSSSGGGTRYLTIGLSTFTKSDSFSWGGNGKETDIGKWGIDMNYRLSQYNSLLDYSLRVSYQEYQPHDQTAKKLIFSYALTLPDAESRFPLYFGAGLGAGVFLSQLPDESPVTLDYQLFLGMRLFNVVESTGFYLEGGLKNHLQLTSDGQLNGTYVSAGAVFTF
jgi:hypothetical protein